MHVGQKLIMIVLVVVMTRQKRENSLMKFQYYNVKQTNEAIEEIKLQRTEKEKSNLQTKVWSFYFTQVFLLTFTSNVFLTLLCSLLRLVCCRFSTGLS